MNILSIFCIYAIGFLLTYKYTLSYFLENLDRYNDFYARQTVAVLVATFWLFFWPAAAIIGPFVSETEND
jgi:hypothetical protein